MCAKRFPTHLSLRQHKLLHTAPKLKCPICAKEYKGNRNLISHMDFMHSDKHKCPHCDYKTGLVAVFRKHVMTHEIEKGSEPPEKATRRCDICAMDFKNTRARRAHINRVHKMEEPLVDEEDENDEVAEEVEIKAEPEERVKLTGEEETPPTELVTKHFCGPCDLL